MVETINILENVHSIDKKFSDAQIATMPNKRGSNRVSRHKEGSSPFVTIAGFMNYFDTQPIEVNATNKLISCSPNLPRIYIRLCKHGNHFTFLYKITNERGTNTVFT